jgi:DNA invertase Pin-like site-specific DNA recombinase
MVAGLSDYSSEIRSAKSFDKLHLKDYVENLGGNGPRVAAYLRVSSSKQVKGNSLEEQFENIQKMKEIRQPSRIYWFFDPAKSGSKGYEKRKMNDILQLRKRGEIDEYWTMRVNRMGREYRRLQYFYLDFSGGGGKIVTLEKEYGLGDLASDLSFVIEAHMAEESNKQRAADAVAGKRRSFLHRHWNKPIPTGYLKEIWLKKSVTYEPVIREAYRLWLSTQSMERVRRRLNETFCSLLQKPLSRNNVRRILSDSIYIGKPSNLGVVISDSSLAFVDEDTFAASLRIFEVISKRHKPKKIGPIEQWGNAHPITAFSEIYKTFQWQHRGCGGSVRKNGTIFDEGIWQQLLKCADCPAEWRFPLIRKVTEDQVKSTYPEDCMGKLVFDKGTKPSRKTSMRSIIKKTTLLNKRFEQDLTRFVAGAPSQHSKRRMACRQH